MKKTAAAKLTGMETKVFAILEARVTKTRPRMASLTVAEIARAAHASERFVRMSLANLERFDLLERHYEPAPKPTTYVLRGN